MTDHPVYDLLYIVYRMMRVINITLYIKHTVYKLRLQIMSLKQNNIPYCRSHISWNEI